jgi:hypothetical protein
MLYVAVPTVVPSTSTCTELIAVPTAVTLSIAQPATVTTPDTVVLPAGASMCTLGGAAVTVIVTLDEPRSGVPSLSVAITVMVCVSGVSMAVFNT